MKFTALLVSYFIVLLVEGHTLPKNIKQLYDTVKHRGCKHYVHNDDHLTDGLGHGGEISLLFDD